MKKATIAKLLVVCLIVSMMSMSIAATNSPAPMAEGDVDGETYPISNGVYPIDRDVTLNVSGVTNGDTATVIAGEHEVTINEGTVSGTVNITVNNSNTKGVTVNSDVKIAKALTVNLSSGNAPVVMNGVTLTGADATLTVFSTGTTELYKAVGSAVITISVNASAQEEDTPRGARAADDKVTGTVELTADGSTFKCLTARLGDVTVTDGTKNIGATVEGDYTVYTRTAATGKAVTLEFDSTKGNVTAPTSAAAGDTVTVTIKPKSNYKVDAVEVYKTGTAADKVAVNLNSAKTTATFVMPDYAVTASVTFKYSGGNTSSSSSSGSTTPVKPAEPTEPTKPVFTDVPAGAYYADAVAWAVEKGITNGLTASTFGPEASCTRGQMVTFLWRLAGSPKAAGTNPFGDITADAYYYDAVMWAVEKGITSGTSADAFSPNATVSRAQSVTFLYRYAGSPATEGGQSFGDVAADAYYANAVTWAAANDITNGTSATTFSPDSPCVRGQIVTFMYRYAGDK